VAYQLFSNILIQASAENSYRLPSSNEIFGNLAQNFESNYALKPEKSKNLNLGVVLGSYTFGKNEARIRFNTFIRDTRDKIRIDVDIDPEDNTTRFINDKKYISKGFDLDVFYSYNKKLDFNANASVFNSRFNNKYEENGKEDDRYKKREPNAPFFTTNSNIRYNISNLFQKESQTVFTTNLSYIHWFYRFWENRGGAGKDFIPTQLVNDVGITHTFPNKKTTIAFDARNIFNRQVFDNYALQKPGRAFYMKINYTIF
jgi:outer membrane receptor protein involved in Fe transport